MKTTKEQRDMARKHWISSSMDDVTLVIPHLLDDLDEALADANEAHAKAARAEAIIERFSTWIDGICGPIQLADSVKKSTLIDGWDRARSPEFFEKP